MYEAEARNRVSRPKIDGGSQEVVTIANHMLIVSQRPDVVVTSSQKELPLELEKKTFKNFNLFEIKIKIRRVHGLTIRNDAVFVVCDV